METDYIEVLFNGTWVKCVPASMQTVDLLTFLQNQWEFFVINASHTFSNDGSTLILKATPKTAGGSVTMASKNLLPVSGKTKIKIVGRVFLYTVAKAVISLVTEDNKKLYEYTTPEADSKWVNISITDDISGAFGYAYLKITLPCYEGHTATQIQLTTLLLC